MATASKQYTVKSYTRSGSEIIKTGTLEELVKCYSYTLEVGHSYDKKINRKPSTFASFLKSYNKAAEIQSNGGSYTNYLYEVK